MRFEDFEEKFEDTYASEANRLTTIPCLDT